MNPERRAEVVEKVATRMKFPQLFALVAALFVIDLMIPDVIPFIDEIMLALFTALLGMWREKVVVEPRRVRQIPAPPTDLPPRPPEDQ